VEGGFENEKAKSSELIAVCQAIFRLPLTDKERMERLW
jgi:hypothetical protein